MYCYINLCSYVNMQWNSVNLDDINGDTVNVWFIEITHMKLYQKTSKFGMEICQLYEEWLLYGVSI